MLDQLGLLRHLSLSASSLFTRSLQHARFTAVRSLAGHPRAPKVVERRRRGGKGRGRQGEEGKEKLPITFYDLISRVMQSHFLYALLVKAITKVHQVQGEG